MIELNLNCFYCNAPLYNTLISDNRITYNCWNNKCKREVDIDIMNFPTSKMWYMQFTVTICDSYKLRYEYFNSVDNNPITNKYTLHNLSTLTTTIIDIPFINPFLPIHVILEKINAILLLS